MWMMSCLEALRVWRIWEKSVSWVFASEEEGWLSELAEALQWVPRMVGGRWKSQHRKIVYHFPYVEKPFNSKVIKSFVAELRSRKCFLCFGIPMLSIYELWTFYVYFTYSYQWSYFWTLILHVILLLGMNVLLNVELWNWY